MAKRIDYIHLNQDSEDSDKDEDIDTGSDGSVDQPLAKSKPKTRTTRVTALGKKLSKPHQTMKPKGNKRKSQPGSSSARGETSVVSYPLFFIQLSNLAELA